MSRTTNIEILARDWELMQKHMSFPPEGVMQSDKRKAERLAVMERVTDALSPLDEPHVLAGDVDGADARVVADYASMVAVCTFKSGTPSLRQYLQTHERLHRIAALFFQAALFADYPGSAAVRSTTEAVDATWIELPGLPATS